MGESKKQTLWQAKGMPDLGNYTAFPTYFTRDLMMASRGISPQFWKFTAIMWRNVMAPAKDLSYPYEFKFTYEELVQYFYIHKKAVARAVAAYEVCGFMDVKKGEQKTPGTKATPTIFRYAKSTPKEAWGAFIGALSLVSVVDRKNHHGGSDIGFKVALAWRVREQRLLMHLSVAHFDSWLDNLKRCGVINSDGEFDRVARTPADDQNLRTREEWYNAVGCYRDCA